MLNKIEDNDEYNKYFKHYRTYINNIYELMQLKFVNVYIFSVMQLFCCLEKVNVINFMINNI